MLVTLAVIAVLISLLLPTLSTVREAAHQVVCRSNVRQMGFGIAAYSEEHKGLIPPSVYVSPGGDPPQPWETNTLRYGPRPGRNLGGWDGLGILFQEEYLPAPKLFYCPSHKGNYPYLNYQDDWAREVGPVRGNYQYRGSGPAGANANQTTYILSEIDPGAALVIDLIRTRSDFNHQIGSNVLRAGLSVGWFSDNEGTFLEGLPKDGDPVVATEFQQIWRNLDNH